MMENFSFPWFLESAETSEHRYQIFKSCICKESSPEHDHMITYNIYLVGFRGERSDQAQLSSLL